MAPDGDESLREEIVRLRDWRHDVVAPGLSAAIARAAQLAEDLEVVGRRLDEMEARLDRMAKADEIADAVTERLAEHTEATRAIRRGRLNAWEQAVVGTAALAGIANIALQVIHR